MSECLADPPAGDDRILAAIEAGLQAADAASEALVPVVVSLERSRRQRAMRMPLPMIVDAYMQSAGLEARHEAATAFHAYEHTLMVVRSEIVRELVEEHDYTLTEVAKTMRVSRQMVARLLQTGRSGTIGPQ